MTRGLKLKLVAGTIAGIAVVGGGAAIAAPQADSPQAESQAVVNDAAQQLGIQPSTLSDALKKALANRVDAAVAAGRLTKDRGDAIKARIGSSDFPIFGGPHGGPGGPGGPGGHFGHHLDAAATYLGLTDAELRTQLESGKTLAQVAADRGKPVDGLVSALADSEQAELDAAVAAGRLTQEREQSILAGLTQRITDLVNGKLPPGPPGPPFRGGPPPFAA